MLFFFFFKQKTAYEMRISDWSSDVCSSDLILTSSQWSKDEGLSEAVKPALMRLCAQYLVQEKASNGRARDPVAHFHLTNGARVERLNWLGDTSAHGMSQSAGLMEIGRAHV